jgi:hypothetical protein
MSEVRAIRHNSAAVVTLGCEGAVDNSTPSFFLSMKIEKERKSKND